MDPESGAHLYWEHRMTGTVVLASVFFGCDYCVGRVRSCYQLALERLQRD